jgi:hypothetical protein
VRGEGSGVSVPDVASAPSHGVGMLIDCMLSKHMMFLTVTMVSREIA